MVTSALLQEPWVIKWLDGVQPAWTLLDLISFAALHEPPSPANGPIRLAADLTPEEVQLSAVARNALVLLRAAADAGPGLKMTATGNLSRAVVMAMCDRIDWPSFDKAKTFEYYKVVNEPDVLPLHFVRSIVQAATLLRPYKGHLRISPAGRRMLEEPGQRTLQAVLFHVALWHIELNHLTEHLLGDWPQCDAGLVLWSLSVAANDWQSRERLTRLCTIPIEAVMDREWDTAAFAMDTQIIRTLEWFGLLECKKLDREPGEVVGRRLYRKTALFDRFLSFDVQLEASDASRH